MRSLLRREVTKACSRQIAQRTTARASLKVGCGLRYHKASRLGWLCGPSAPLGRGTVLRLDQPQSSALERLRGDAHFSLSVPLRSIRHAPHPTVGTVLVIYGTASQTTRSPACHEPGVSRLGLLDPAPLLITMALEIVGVGRSFLAAGGRVPCLEFELAHLLGMQRRAGPQVALAFAQ